MPAYATAGVLIPFRQGPGAEVKRGAAQDDEIRVGANHRQAARQSGAQHRLVILYPVVPSRRAGIEDELGVLGSLDELEVEPLADLEIAFGADVQAMPPERRIEGVVAPEEMLPRFFAGRHDMTIEPHGHADFPNSPHDVIRSARRVG